MTALLEATMRQPRGPSAGRYSALHAGWHYSSSGEVSNGVGCPAMGAERLSVGRVTGTIALLDAAQWLSPSTFFEVVRVDLLNHISRRGGHADIKINHQRRECLPVNQYDLGINARSVVNGFRCVG